jgi:phosphopantothenoylcysteine decarboxylase/phosphopantothenate--cysteine ligase
MLKGKKILVGISGGIAAYKICNLVRLFIKAGAEVRVIMTPSATKFVSPLTLSVLSRNEVIINIFNESDFSKAESVNAGTWHIEYGMWADVFLIAPATANTIAKIVCGISDNFLLSAVLASRCGIIVAPTMDEDMFKAQITQDNIKKLRERGIKIIEPIEGELASGLNGIGKMAEPEDIFEFVRLYLKDKKDLINKKVLVTAGPTVESIDPVRFISNYSSGKMGFEIAKAAFERGAEVTLISGPVNLSAHSKIKRIDVQSAQEMFTAVKDNIKGKDFVVMAAAVSDFKPKNISGRKIKSINEFNLSFSYTTDILHYLGKNKKRFKLIGFALETENEIANAKKKLKSKNLDMIVLNNPSVEGAGFGTDTNKVTLIDKKDVTELPLMSKRDVADSILDYYVKNLS